MKSRGATTSSRFRKLPPAQLEAAIKRLEAAGRKETNPERKAKITANLKNLRVLAQMKHIRNRETKGSAANPIKGPPK